MYTLLQVLLDNCVSRGACPILGGDFNACIGLVSGNDDVDLVGCSGFGERNAQGMLLAQWVMQNGLYIANRQEPTHQTEDSWTCRRSSDGILTQIDFIILDRRTVFDNTWNDNVIPIGLDHRCVHCTFHFNTSRIARRARLQKMKNWEPTLDEDGRPAKYHHEIQRRLATSRVSFGELEQILLDAGTRGGKSSRISFGFSGFGWTSKAPIAKAFGPTWRGTSEVVIADSDIISTRVSCMEVIKIRRVFKEFEPIERNFPTSCNTGPASSGATSSKWICKYVGTNFCW